MKFRAQLIAFVSVVVAATSAPVLTPAPAYAGFGSFNLTGTGADMAGAYVHGSTWRSSSKVHISGWVKDTKCDSKAAAAIIEFHVNGNGFVDRVEQPNTFGLSCGERRYFHYETTKATSGRDWIAIGETVCNRFAGATKCDRTRVMTVASW